MIEEHLSPIEREIYLKVIKEVESIRQELEYHTEKMNEAMMGLDRISSLDKWYDLPEMITNMGKNLQYGLDKKNSKLSRKLDAIIVALANAGICLPDVETVLVSDLDINNRALSILEKDEVKTVAELCELTPKYISNLSNAGRATLHNIRHALAKKGLFLKNEDKIIKAIMKSVEANKQWPEMM